MSRPLVSLSLALILGAGALAGCIDTPAGDVDSQGAPDVAAQLASYVPPTGAGAVGFLDSYVMTHPFRLIPPGGGPTDLMVSARDDLASELEAMGLNVVRQKYSESGTNILAFKNGAVAPDEWLVLSAHYDTTETTVYGAWDDGAGTAMLLELAKAGATREFNRTIVYAFFDEEEQGLLGSKAFVEEYQTQATLVGNLNFDPPGLNWPCADAQGPLPVKIIFNQAKVDEAVPGYVELRDAVLAGLDAAGVPEEVRDYSPGIPIATLAGVGVSGTSDHASFDAVDVPNAFIGSAPTSSVGPAAALTYLLHTPLDTREQMEVRCGGADLLEQAFGVELVVTEVALGILDGR